MPRVLGAHIFRAPLSPPTSTMRYGRLSSKGPMMAIRSLQQALCTVRLWTQDPSAWKNTHNKTTASATCQALTLMLVKCTSVYQNGFAPTRQLTQNAIELDATAPVHALWCLGERNVTGRQTCCLLIKLPALPAHCSIDRRCFMFIVSPNEEGGRIQGWESVC